MTEPQRILLVDDRPANLGLLREALDPEGYELLVATSGEAALASVAHRRPDLVLLDVVMPGIDGYETCRRLKSQPEAADLPVIFITARDDKDSLVQAFAVGAVDYLTKPFAPEEVIVRVRTHLALSRMTRDLSQQAEALAAANRRLRDEIERRHVAERARQAADERLEQLAAQESNRWGIEGFVGQSPTIGRILEETRQLQSAGTAAVLILGESGTGKELIARAIHSGSPRSQGPFVPVNCSAIPAELAESILFGHLRGSFTGAQSDRKGCFEMADGGTLFLDEIGDMPPDLQAKLLRVLDNGWVTPVGASEGRKVEVRVVAATNADLSAAIAAGRFRRDLYFRLAHMTVTIPPLRERREDIPLLVHHFVELFSEEMGHTPAGVEPEAMERLSEYGFPGNVRELKNLVEAALIRGGCAPIRAEHLAFLGGPSPAPAPGPQAPAASTGSAADPEQVVTDYVRTHGRITNRQCRQLLGVDRHRASYLLDKLTTAGILQRLGANRGSHYRLAGPA